MNDELPPAAPPPWLTFAGPDVDPPWKDGAKAKLLGRNAPPKVAFWGTCEVKPRVVLLPVLTAGAVEKSPIRC